MGPMIGRSVRLTSVLVLLLPLMACVILGNFKPLSPGVNLADQKFKHSRNIYITLQKCYGDHINS